MSRRSLRSNFVVGAVAGVVFAAVGLLPTACDSTLNLGGLVDASALDGGWSVGAATCGSVCDKLLGCGYAGIPPRATCVASCQQMATQSVLDCIANHTCATLGSACGSQIPQYDSSIVDPPPFDSGGEVMFDTMNCQEGCDQLLRNSCISAQEQSTCRDKCVTSAKRTTFFSCSESAGFDCATGRDCLSVFVGD